MLKVLLCIACGVVFGIALHKAHVMEPAVIRRQMLMKQFTMLKFFLSALATSMFTLSVMAMLPFSSGAFTIACNGYYSGLSQRSVASSLVGGTLMGLGMTVSGSCSSSVFVQLGSLVPNSYYTFLGAFLAVIVYGVTKPFWDNLLKPSIAQSSNPWANSPYFILALPLVAMFGITACAFETLVPSENEIKFTSKSNDSFMAYSVWPPYIGGILVGALQLPLVLGLNKTLGGSSSINVIAAQLFVGPLKKLSPYLANLRWGFNNCWQIFYATGAVLGAYISATASGTLGATASLSPMTSFLGGFILFLGTRIGGGCTSGHGLSGMGLLSILSFIMIASTFASGITSAFVLSWFKLI
jgi:uncharacterized membrane protein YedE/YeeE